MKALLCPLRLIGMGSASQCVGGHNTGGRYSVLCSLFCVGSACHCGVGNDKCLRYSVLCSLFGRGICQHLWYLARQLLALL